MRVAEVPERIVVDASVGLKWVLREEHSDRAVALGPGRELLTSALFWAESGNAIATRIRRGDLDKAAASEAFQDLQTVPLRTRPLDGTAAAAALMIARELMHPIYDCCYLALAIEENSIVITADQRFRSAVAAHPALADRVVLLRDIALR
ncbi:MAG TPA: type II toxin-antitoxin system VapC family toxin [Acetobacteraceae bacterium]|jgi:predicted nucleic acid-binding protein